MTECVICGKMFEPAPRHKNWQKTCSIECRTIYNKEYDMSDRNLKKRRERYRNTKNAYCRLCGKPIIRKHDVDNLSTTRMHDSCIYLDCKKTLDSGEILSKAQAERLYYRGWTIKEFKKALTKDPELLGIN